MADPITPAQAEQKILENAANPVDSYEIDGEKTELKDPVKQLKALEMLARRSASRNPLAAIRTFHFPSGSGER